MPRPTFPGRGWSFWLLPADETVHMAFNQCIGDLAMRYHRGPLFTPHVTLHTTFASTGGTDMVARTEELVTGIKPFVIDFSPVPQSVADSYFQALVLPVEATEVLMDLNLKARELLGELHSPAYWPHLGLAYGGLTEAMRNDMVADVQKRRLPTSMLVNGVDLYDILSSDPRQWYHIRKFRFTS